MSRYAIIDLGTNSIKFFLAEVDKNEIRTIVDINNISRLGEGLQKSGVISPEAMERNVEVMNEFKKLADSYQADYINAVGTMCLRTAKNSNQFIDKVFSKTGIKIEVLDGKQEARLAYLAVVKDYLKDKEEIVVFDTGGGSTEFIFGIGLNLNDRFSLNIGAVRLTEEFLVTDPVEKKAFNKLNEYILDFFKDNKLERKVKKIVGIGGTLTSLGAVKHRMEKYDPDVIQGSILTMAELDEMIDLFLSKTIEQRKKIIGLQPKRADVILAGSAIVRCVMSNFKVNELQISDRGLRHGLLIDLIK